MLTTQTIQTLPPFPFVLATLLFFLSVKPDYVTIPPSLFN